MSSQMNDVTAVSVAFIAAERALVAHMKELQGFFPHLDASGLKKMAHAVAQTANVVGPVVASTVIEPVTHTVSTESVVESEADEFAEAVPVEEEKRTRPHHLMIIKPNGKEMTLPDAILAILDDKVMKLPEIVEAMVKKGWTTNSQTGMNIHQNVYITVNGKPELFQRNSDANNRKNTTYQAKSLAAPKATKAPVVTKAEGKAPSSEEILKIIKKKFVGKQFAVRDVAKLLGVEARTISVNTRTLKEANVIKAIGPQKIGGVGPEIMFYQLT